jgi:hypothetical protein
VHFRGEDNVTSPTAETSFVSVHERLPAAVRDEYWANVKAILVKVFHHDAQAADAARESIESFEQEKGQPLTIFYHADPFEVAADLAGRRMKVITPDEKARYQSLMRQIDSPPAMHVSATHPEDA